jgi:hypothetical protein
MTWGKRYSDKTKRDLERSLQDREDERTSSMQEVKQDKITSLGSSTI